jgi:hypothetical protein
MSSTSKPPPKSIEKKKSNNYSRTNPPEIAIYIENRIITYKSALLTMLFKLPTKDLLDERRRWKNELWKKKLLGLDSIEFNSW